MHLHECHAHGEHMLSLHETILACKSVSTTRDLLLLLQKDWAKFTSALSATQHLRADRVIGDFFDGSVAMARAALEATSATDVSHVGFEVSQPLDMLMTSIPLWLAALNAAERRRGGDVLRLSKLHRFPASDSFQQRVAAYAEIMRVWIRRGERDLMLEFFDIHRSASNCPMDATRNGAFVPGGEMTAQAFRGDSIWHLALRVDSPAKVARLHADLSIWAGEAAGYVLTYAAPVANVHDGSVHTKVINTKQQTELEFVAQL
jgi:hypothetical protein